MIGRFFVPQKKGVRRSGGASRQTREEADEGYQSTKGGILGRAFRESVDLRHIRELLRHKDCYISENSCGTKKVGLSQGDIEFLSLVLQKAEADDNPGLHVVSTQHKKSKSGECTPPTRRVWAALHRRYAQRWPGLMADVSSRWVNRSSRTYENASAIQPYCCADATRHQATRPTGEDEDSEPRSADTASDLSTPQEEARAAVGTGPSHKEEDDYDVWDGIDQFDMDTIEDRVRTLTLTPCGGWCSGVMSIWRGSNAMVPGRRRQRTPLISHGRRLPGRSRWLAFLRACALGLVMIPSITPLSRYSF